MVNDLALLSIFYLWMVGCGSRSTEEKPESPPPTVRGIVSSQRTAWQGTPAISGNKTSPANVGNEEKDRPVIKVFFLRSAFTMSDGEDYAETEEIKSWFGVKPIEH